MIVPRETRGTCSRLERFSKAMNSDFVTSITKWRKLNNNSRTTGDTHGRRLEFESASLGHVSSFPLAFPGRSEICGTDLLIACISGCNSMEMFQTTGGTSNHM